MTVRVYRSTDAGAPVLTGQVGSLLGVLNACLVNGYGALAAAGWTKPIADAGNKGHFKQNTAVSNNASGMFLYVDDSGPGGGGAREARVCGFETMSALTPTGTGQFPAAAQSGIGFGALVIRKSATADATARAWTLAALTFIFGDFKSFRSPDPWAVHIIGRNAENTSTSSNESFCLVAPISTYNLADVSFGHFIARHWTGQGGSIKCGKWMDWTKLGYAGGLQGGWSSSGQTSIGGSTNFMPGRYTTATQLPAPNGSDGSLVLSPLWLSHSFAWRGYLPGLFVPLHDRPLNHNDVLTITSGNMNGKTLLCQQPLVYISGNDYGNILVETSDTWS
jgi:hypothetical protein